MPIPSVHNMMVFIFFSQYPADLIISIFCIVSCYASLFSICVVMYGIICIIISQEIFLPDRVYTEYLLFLSLAE